MKVIDKYVESIYERTQTLDELLATSLDTAMPEDISASRWDDIEKKWSSTATGGDQEKFQKILKSRVRLLRSSKVTSLDLDNKNIETSTSEIEEMRFFLECLISQNNQAPFFADNNTPFDELYGYLISRYSHRLRTQFSDSSIQLQFLSNDAWTDLQRDLLSSISSLLEIPIYDEFRLRCHSVNLEQTSKDSKKMSYEDFLTFMRQVGFKVLFEKYPVLLRVLASVANQWMSSSNMLLNRLLSDDEVIDQNFETGRLRKNCIKSISGGLSDPHHGGCAVRIITFARNNKKIVYKPKNLYVDMAFMRFVDFLNRRNPPIDLKPHKVISSINYGWSEYVPVIQCASSGDVNEFYFRSGALLALLYTLAGSDMHQENVIASGPYPIPIDLEMLFQPFPQEKLFLNELTRARDAAAKKILNSVLNVGLLPSFALLPDEQVKELGALSVDIEHIVVKHWENLRTEQLSYTLKRIPLDGARNLPLLNKQKISVANYVSDFTCGFSQYLKFLIDFYANEPDFLSNNFQQLKIRKIFRPTIFYDILLSRLKDFRSMGNGCTWSLQAEFVYRSYDPDEDEDVFLPILEAEKKALLGLNVPYFSSSVDKTIIEDDDCYLTLLTAQNGLARCKENINSLKSDSKFQEDLVSTSLDSLCDNQNYELFPYTTLNLRDGDREISDEDFTSEIKRETENIYRKIETKAIVVDNTASWVTLKWHRTTEVAQISVMDDDIYNGTSGLAIFLSAYASHTKDSHVRNLALAALAGTRYLIRSGYIARWARTAGIGGLTGLGSLVYGFSVVAQNLGDDECLNDAVKCSEFLTPELVSADRVLDLLGGSAGCALALLKLYSLTGNARCLEKAILCGEHILKTPRRFRAERSLWSGVYAGDSPLNGMSHGASGFAAAFYKLAYYTSRDDFLKAGNECIAFEDHFFDKSKNNWPDFRRAGDVRWTCQWCHGACGVGLSRLLMMKYGFFSPEIERDLNNAKESVGNNWPQVVDTLCCGTLGNIELIRECEIFSKTHNHQSRQMLGEVLRSGKRNGYRWTSGETKFNLGLFCGLAGVGYTYLRAISSNFPNVLIFE